MSGEPINLSVLTSMFGDDKVLCDSILEEFSSNAEPYLLELSEAVERGDAGGVKSLAHKLKSSSLTVGAEELSELCEALEYSAPNKNWTFIDRQQLAIKNSLEKVVNFIRENK